MRLLDEIPATEVDGVPVLWAAGPEPLSAALVFRVGRADESFVDGGVTHLVEHLVMRGVGRVPIEANAHVSAHTTTFEATGSARHVVDFLARVCRQLERLDTTALEVERGVLTAEAERSGGGPAAEAASLRYGCRGAALTAYRDLGVAHLGAAAVEAWAARWFTRGNAVLALTGPVPDGLRLPLPPGERAAVAPLAPRALQLPAWDSAAGGTAVSLRLRTGDGTDLAIARMLARAGEDAVRHERGLAYDVGTDGLRVDLTTSEVALHADNDPERAAAVAGLLLDVVERFATAGPSAAEVEADVEQAFEALADPRATGDATAAAAQELLLGLPVRTPAQRFQQTRDRDAHRLRAAVGEALAEALVLLPGDAGLERPGLRRLAPSSHPLPAGRELRPRLFRGVPRGVRLVVGDDGVALRLAEGDVVAPWGDVVGVSVLPDGTHVLQTGDGPAVPVDAGDFRGAGDVLAQLRRRVPPALFVPEPQPARAGRAPVGSPGNGSS
ncbi:hypothetical protein [Kineococcus sp. SYSU DK001]|uniref:hypothetical protein n=1 Tax=Kineococcus sp. SYSU DK001 TaxID=3383122 RepID=UPI003D7DBF44